MFRIRRIFDDVGPANQYAIDQARAILRSQFELLDRRRIDRIPESLGRVRDFGAIYLIVCFGLDTSKGDPTGTWNFTGRDFTTIGTEIGRLRKPCLVVQEGSYNNRSIGTNAKSFFNGLLSGADQGDRDTRR